MYTYTQLMVLRLADRWTLRTLGLLLTLSDLLGCSEYITATTISATTISAYYYYIRFPFLYHRMVVLSCNL